MVNHTAIKHYARGHEGQNYISQAVGLEGVRLGGSLPAVHRIMVDRPGVATGSTVTHDAAAITKSQRRKPTTVAVHVVGETASVRVLSSRIYVLLIGPALGAGSPVRRRTHGHLAGMSLEMRHWS
ncbi:predicted protein [Streptomyces sp. C]|nr:predicted protein [Streptomyces sp. C]